MTNAAANVIPFPRKKPVIAPDAVQVGDRYEATRDLDLAEIAKLIRRDIAAEVKAGRLPKARYSVRIRRYSMGQAIDVEATGLPFTTRTPAEERVAGEPKSWLTREAFAVETKLEALRNAYNRSRTNHQSDYSDARYYGSTEV